MNGNEEKSRIRELAEEIELCRKLISLAKDAMWAAEKELDEELAAAYNDLDYIEDED